MLVLSRKVDEKIVFPNLGVKLHILRVRGKLVRVGIDAPPEVRVLRDDDGADASDPPSGAAGDARATHDRRNRLNKITLWLHLLGGHLRGKDEIAATATLQRVLAELEALDRDWSSVQPAQQSDPAASPLRALVVDDDSNERELLAGLLSMNGCHCETAEDGLAALDYLATHDRPDFVLLDMWMPRCDGRQTVERIRKDPRHRDIKVFAISGGSPAEVGIEPGSRGVDAWFSKPLNPRRLWDAMRYSARGAQEIRPVAS